MKGFNPRKKQQPSAKEVTDMATITSIKTEVKFSNMLKACMLGVVAAAGFGFMALPAKAGEIYQDGRQTTIQQGSGNTSVEQMHQNAEVENSDKGYYPYGNYGYDKDVIRQTGDQFIRQEGHGNTAVEQLNQDAKIRNERGSWHW